MGNLIKTTTLPTVIEENYIDSFNRSTPIVYTENADAILAKKEAVQYINLLKEKIQNDHIENMEKILSEHKQVMKSLETQIANNFIAGLSSEDRLKIDSVEVKPYVLENTVFGLKKKDVGVTIVVNRRY